MIRVVCAVIMVNEKYLVTQRSQDMTHPLQWEFPGGKLNPGELEEDGLIREIKEELNITIRPIKRLQPVVHAYPDKNIELIPYLCEITAGILQLKEHAAFREVPKEQLSGLNWVQADIDIVRQLTT